MARSERHVAMFVPEQEVSTMFPFFFGGQPDELIQMVMVLTAVLATMCSSIWMRF
jgi:hypothetical protein